MTTTLAVLAIIAAAAYFLYRNHTHHSAIRATMVVPVLRYQVVSDLGTVVFQTNDLVIADAAAKFHNGFVKDRETV